MDRLLVLEDGSVWKGKAFGSDNFKVGELVFNTAMTGYQEILTDSSYCGQIVMMTYPLIGNYGINRDDWENLVPSVFGLVVKDLCEDYSNWRANSSLNDFCKQENIAGIYDVDTRAITRRIRDKGVMRCMMCNADANIDEVLETIRNTPEMHDQVQQVSAPRIYSVPNRGLKVVVMDFGSKLSIIRDLAALNLDIVVVPWNTDVKTIMSFCPDGVVLTDGPGDPTDIPEAIETVRQLMGQVPMFGICLGHQLISLACGAKTYKLKFGHRGSNHPVVHLSDGHVEITSQNHGYAVDIDSLANTDLVMTHKALNDNSCEGVAHKTYPVFGLQFQPTATDGTGALDAFVRLMTTEKENKKNA